MYDYRPLDRMNVQRPRKHGMLLLAFPTEEIAAQISNRTKWFCARYGLSSRPLAADRLHITLFDLGEHPEVPEDVTRKAAEAATTMVSPPVTITFDRLLTFRTNAGAQPLVLSGGDGLAELHRFRQKLALALVGAGLKKFVKSGFTPHMTLLYDRHTVSPRTIDPVRWTMTEFVLVDSLRGETRHIHLARWPLRGR